MGKKSQSINKTTNIISVGNNNTLQKKDILAIEHILNNVKDI